MTIAVKNPFPRTTRRSDEYSSGQTAPAMRATSPVGGYRDVTRSNPASSGGGPTPSSLDDESHRYSPRWLRCFQSLGSFLRPSRAVLDRASIVIHSRLWHILLVFFTFLLLFGAQIQELWIPKEGDMVFDILFTIALFVFAVDLVVRCYIEPQYFEFNLCGKSQGENWGSCRLGSFMFWCDLVSSATLLYDISYINPRLWDTVVIEVELDNFGLPISGLEGINRALPVRPELELLVSIGRTARVARFIRASTVMKSSSKINWYWIYQRANPAFYFQRVRQRRANRHLSASGLDGEAPEGLSTRSGRDARTGLMIRHASWGGVQLGVLAAVKKAQLHAQLEEQRKNSPQEKGVRGLVRRMLRGLGILRTGDEEIRRHIAATRIQRAWRATVNQHRQGSSPLPGEDVAWAPSREASSAQLDDIPKKRSILRPYNNVNLKSGKASAKAKRSMLHMTVKNHARSVVGRRRPESQVGSAMRELTGQRVAIGIIIALILTVLFTYSEKDATRPSTMIVLHNQTQNEAHTNASLSAARESSIPDLFQYVFANGTTQNFTLTSENPATFREREILRISVEDPAGSTTTGYFAFRNESRDAAVVELCSIVFILLVWYFGVTAFAGPVMTLVVIPIERMVRLLGMLTSDPLGYQSTPRYKRFVAEEDELTLNTRWTKEVLKGMETSFLMSTILRIGSLMKVGFGSAGVEIIRNSLEPGQQSKDTMLILDSKGSTVSCIFLFCDIRQFTDATECLQEEVFVFTNRIAAVVHSICHAYGGSANKNVGDAFLLSWLLEDDSAIRDSRSRAKGSSNPVSFGSGSNATDSFTATSNQADKALLSVVKICMALHHDQFYIETMTEQAREALLTKLAKRKGPVVQMGFGLHAGRAVQGAIGSQRKIDATYVSEAVERAEFLESSTKKYGLKMLMSDNFHRLLHPSNRRRCRKIDQILLQSDDDNDETYDEGDIMELFTFDMDIDALWKTSKKNAENTDSASETDSMNEATKGSKRDVLEKKTSTRHIHGGGLLKGPRRRSMNRIHKPGESTSEEFKSASSTSDAAAAAAASVAVNSSEFGHEIEGASSLPSPPELVLPTGPTLYNANVWLSEDMRKIRELFSDGLFFQKFNSGLQSYYTRDWEHAKQCFLTILERFDDGPSRYFLKCINENNGVPPRHFPGYGTA